MLSVTTVLGQGKTKEASEDWLLPPYHWSKNYWFPGLVDPSTFRGTQLPKTMWELVAGCCKTQYPVLIACSPFQFR